MKKLIFLYAFCGIFISPLFSQKYGFLDPTFNKNGKLLVNLGGTEVLQDVKIQDDQKIVVCGQSTFFPSPHDAKVMRILPNGTVDSTFGVNGIYTFSIGLENYAYDLYILKNGQILVAGIYYYPNYDAAMLLFRLNSDGTLDSSFGTAGFTLGNFTPGDDLAEAVAVQSDGKILVAGESGNKPTIACFSENGILDLTFGVNGLAQIPIMKGGSFRGMTMQPDGKIVAAGNWDPTSAASMPNFGVLVARFNSNGILDPSFAASVPLPSTLSPGVLYYPITGFFCGAFGITLKNDGKILVVGQADYIDNGFVLQLDKDGIPDNTFGTSVYQGVSIYDETSSDTFYDVKLQPDGKILCAGSIGNDFLLVRYNSDGSFDKIFGNNNGFMNTDYLGPLDRAHSLALQKNGKIVLAGAAGPNRDFATARYINKINDVLAIPAEIERFTDFRVWPTIVSKDQTITLSGEIQNHYETEIGIYNALGDLISSFDLGNQANGSMQFQLPATISSGMYFLRLKNKEYSSSSVKLIVTD